MKKPSGPVTAAEVVDLFAKLEHAIAGASVSHGERRAERARRVTLLSMQLEVCERRRLHREHVTALLHRAIDAYERAVEDEKQSHALLERVAASVAELGPDCLPPPRLEHRSMFTKGDDDDARRTDEGRRGDDEAHRDGAERGR